MNDLRQSAVDGIELFNKADWDGLRALLGPTFRYEETGTGLIVDDAEDFITALQAWKTAAPDSAGELTRVVADGDTTVLEVLWRGTQTGPLPTAAGVLPASGRASSSGRRCGRTGSTGRSCRSGTTSTCSP